ncbi:F-box protein At5g07610-like [Castanea sativa]|uniref:F-box protein At5g07610-like n=1 Tax=Castanea sativa TaxID=21020 RepID=UPI003F650682
MDSCRWVIKQESEFPLNDLPDSVLIEVLILLPLLSVVLHCKWVSKRWFSLISTPYFVRRFITQHHHQQQQEQPFMLLNHFFDCPSHKRLHIANSSNKPELKSIAAYLQSQDRDHSRNYHINNWLRASCNDLLLCFHKAKDRVVIYSVINPITRQCLVLPPVPRRLLLNRVGIICNYDYNNSSSSFRVVLIPNFRTKLKVFKVHIFSSDTSKWSESVVLVPDQKGFELYQYPFPAVPYKGLLFWCGTGGRLLGFDPYNNGRCCHSFVIEGPVELATSIDCFGVSQGCLRISKIAFPGLCLRIWELKDYDSDNNGGRGKWCLKHKVYNYEMVSEKWLIKYVDRNYKKVSVLAFHPNDGDIVYLLIQSKVVLCNLQSNTMEVFCDIPQIVPYNVFKPLALTFVLPSWPTPIPSSPLQKQDGIAD